MSRKPINLLLILIAVAILLWLILAPWPSWLIGLIGKKKIFVSAILNGVTLGGLYFLVASGFTLIFGLMQNVNLAHGSLYLLGGYIGYSIVQLLSETWGLNYNFSWFAAIVLTAAIMAGIGVLLQMFVFRRMHGEDMRQTLVTIGISIVLADIMLWVWGGDFIQIETPDWLFGAFKTPIVSVIKSSGDPVYIKYPIVRLVIFAASIVIGICLWLFLEKTRTGMIIRAGVDDRNMVSATGIKIQVVFAIVFAIGAALAGLAGVVGATFQSLAPGEDTRFLLASLVVVIVGGMGSVQGAAVGAIVIGLAEQVGSVYFPTYAVVITFLIMVAVLAFRPQGLMGVKR